jgi:glycosyltransferase involved in cell wall biosynthesis
VQETISVITPAYNVEKLISYTLESVLQQTLQPLEILVMDDGSTDGTREVLKRHGNRIRLFTQKNSGVAAARNFLVKQVRGSLVALMDSDDIWHPQYLETVAKNAKQFPEAAAFFMGHVAFVSNEDHKWEPSFGPSESLSGRQLFQRVNENPGAFECASCFTVRRDAILQLGDTPFQVDSCEDFYCYSLLSLRYASVFMHNRLLAYRIHDKSLSANRVKGLGARIRVYEKLQPHFGDRYDFPKCFASHRRYYAKYLLGAQRISEAREQLRLSMEVCSHPASLAKSMSLLASTYLPSKIQPTWPVGYRGHAAA